MTDVLIVIPSRYQSTRLPGKPLIKIKGIEMIKRVANIAAYVCHENKNCSYVVATDDSRIEEFCIKEKINVVMTSEHCKNGTERCWEATLNLENSIGQPQLIINLQGDNPLCPPWIIQNIIDEWKKDTAAAVYTPFVQLDWNDYNQMLEAKKETPASGTTVIIDKNGYAMAFSKNIIPSIRNNDKAMQNMTESPVKRHIGLYAYSYNTLKEYNSLEKSVYEQNYIEGLEQMRFLYNALKVKMVKVDYQGRETTSGVDAPEDIVRVEAIIEKYGELIP